MSSKVKMLICFISIFQVQNIWAGQESANYIDSLKMYSNGELEKKYFISLKDKRDISLFYAQELLSRAKLKNERLEIAKFYNWIIKTSPKEKMTFYSDSLIALAEGYNLGYYPGIAYYTKALVDYESKNFLEALDNLLIADSILNMVDSVETKYWIKQAIGTLKSKTGDYEGALDEYRVNLKYFEKIEDWDTYNYNVYSAIESYLKINQIDSADYYCKKALTKSSDPQKLITPYLRMSAGIIDYYKGNYGKSIEVLSIYEKKMDSLNDFDNLAHCYHYLGLANLSLNNKKIALSNFQKVDSIFQKNKYINLSLRDSYVNLIEHFRQTDNNKKELYYLTNLISLDSITNSYNLSLKDNIFSLYETPKLLKRKEDVLFEYQINQKKFLFIIVVLTVLVAISFLIIYFLKRRERKKKLQFEKIIIELKQTEKQPLTKSKSSTIPERDIEILNIAFRKYELNKEYANKNFNKEYIRKDTEINNHYIADYLRDFIGCSLITYINDKRIELALEKILNDSVFPKFTMHAMAETVGFTNAGTFKRAFQKRVGMSPLDFLLQSSKVSNS